MGSVDPIFEWHPRDYDRSYVCRMWLPMPMLRDGIAGDGILQGNEEAIACYDIRVEAPLTPWKKSVTESVLYARYLESLKPKVKKPNYMLLIK